jgi:choline monooxygenase
VTPLSAMTCRLNVGFCFPKSTVARLTFEREVEAYYRRWDIGIAEDNNTGTLQQAGLRSPLYEPGPLSWKEPKVQSIALWILGRVLDSPATLSSRAAE